MQRSKIPLLQRFDVISNIVPYYAHTHLSFLLLSSLWVKSRHKLDEYYEEFVRYMIKYWLWIKINSKNNRMHLLLPTDLFKFDISIFWQNTADWFIDFIEKYSDYKMWSFCSHSMHSQINLHNPVLVHTSFIEQLYPHIDKFKTIQVNLVNMDVETLSNFSQSVPLLTMHLNFIFQAI